MKRIFIQRLGMAYLLAMGAQILAVSQIQQIQVTQQTGSSCGYHAVYNAKAVETLALQGRQLTAAAIVQEARQYRNFIQRDALLSDTIIYLASQLDIDNLYCINGRNGLGFAGSSQGAQEGNLFLRDITTQRQHVHPLIGHFIVNTGGHWVVFSVIKNPGQQPIVLYMDSVNTPLARNRTAHAVGTTLLARLGVVSGGRVDVPRPERNSSRYRKPGAHVKKPDYVQPDYVQEYDEHDLSVEKTYNNDGFSYKTYIAVGLVCLFIGFKLGSSK